LGVFDKEQIKKEWLSKQLIAKFGKGDEMICCKYQGIPF